MGVRLWEDEIEACREEVRGMLSHLPTPASAASIQDPIERAEVQRRTFREMMPPVPPSERAEATAIPGPAGDLPVRLFRPDGPARALFLHIHGGGWILGEPGMSDPVNELLATQHGLAVLSVDYRLAPEHPYPAGPDDCEAALSWLLEKGPAELGADRVLIGGESAGGHLTLVTALRARDRLGALERLLGLNLVFGWYDLNGTPSQHGNNGLPDMLDPEGLRFMVECFTPGLSETERRAPDLSPLFADLRGLPPCMVSVGTGDHLCDDSLFLANRLAAAEVEVDLAAYPDMPHGYQALPTKMAAASAARIDAWIGRVLERAGL